MKNQNAEIWGGNKAPDGSPIFDDQTCYAIVDTDVIQFWIFSDDEIDGLDPEDYDWQNMATSVNRNKHAT